MISQVMPVLCFEVLNQLPLLHEVYYNNVFIVFLFVFFFTLQADKESKAS